MDIHEYQAKEILSSFGVTIPRGGIVYSPETAENKAREIGGSRWVVKAQIHSGARGKAGGVIVCNSPLEVAQATDKLLGKKLVTNQTGPEGKIVNRIYIEEATDIEKELYLGLVFDRESESIMVVASTQLLNEPCPGKTTLSLDLIFFKSAVTSIFTLSLATSLKELITELILPEL